VKELLLLCQVQLPLDVKTFLPWVFLKMKLYDVLSRHGQKKNVQEFLQFFAFIFFHQRLRLPLLLSSKQSSRRSMQNARDSLPRNLLLLFCRIHCCCCACFVFWLRSAERLQRNAFLILML